MQNRESKGASDGFFIGLLFFAALAAIAGVVGAEATSAPESELERNRAVARKFLEEAFGPHWRIELADELHTSDFVIHTRDGDLGLKEDRDALLRWKAVAPDLVMHVDDIVAEGDRVAVRWTAAGTDTGGFVGGPATGLKVTASGMTFWRMEDGKIAEEWGVVDMLSVLKQLGALPTE